MHFPSLICALGALVSTISASPIQVEKRQSRPPTPPYVSQGVAIHSCRRPNTIALTFDDGITSLADSVINQLNAAGMKGTFFVNGENWGRLRDHAPTLRRMITQGHQVGSHTWDHPHLTEGSSAAARSEMTRLENEMLNLVGQYPTYMRPPYFEYNAQTLSVMKSLKYRVIIADVDTNDWKLDPNVAFNDFRAGLDRGGSIVLAHDVHETTVNQLLPRMIAELRRRGMRSVTVGECLGEHPNNWYRYGPR